MQVGLSIVALIFFFALGGGGFLFWRRHKLKANSMAGSAFNLGVNMVGRLKERVPASLRSPGAVSVPGDKTGVGLQGNLAQTPLHDLLQYLALGGKSGILELTSGRRTGRLVLHNGRVRKNSYRGKEGLEAVFMMMDLTEGDFEFSEQVLEEPSPQMDLEVVDVIMMWMNGKPKKKTTAN